MHRELGLDGERTQEGEADSVKGCRGLEGRSEDVVLVNLDGPLELVHQNFGQELLDGNVVLLGPGDSDSRIDVVDF